MAIEKKSGAGNRKEFVRTKVPLAENIASAVILLLLVVIGSPSPSRADILIRIFSPSAPIR